MRFGQIGDIEAVIILAPLAFAQYGGQGIGSALSSNPLSHQEATKPGIDDLASRAATETPFKIIKDVKLGLKDADPAVRVTELEKLRNLQDPEVNQILISSMSDPDVRVKVKAVDILGARGANDAVTPMSTMLVDASGRHSARNKSYMRFLAANMTRLASGSFSPSR